MKISPLVNRIEDGGEIVEIEVGDEIVEIEGGDYVFGAKLYPENLSGETRIFEEIGGNHILKLNAVTGVAQALFSGETQVRITCPEGREGLEKVLTVNVNVDTDSTGFAVNGKSSGAKVTVKIKRQRQNFSSKAKTTPLKYPTLLCPKESRQAESKGFPKTNSY